MLWKQFVGCLEDIREGDKNVHLLFCETNEEKMFESLSYAKPNIKSHEKLKEFAKHSLFCYIIMVTY